MRLTKRLKVACACIVAIAGSASFFVGTFLSQYKTDTIRMAWLASIFMIPFVIHAIVSFSFLQGWFDMNHISTLFIMQSTIVSVRVFALFAVFDLVLRLTERTDWMFASNAPFIGDAAWIALLILWSMVGYWLPERA